MCNLKISLSEFSHISRKVGPKVQERINALKIGQKMQDLPEELWHNSFLYYVKHAPDRNGGPNLRIIRLDPNKPSLTVTGFIFNKFVHPYENRYITPREAARLQGFPDDYLFSGPLTSVQRQVGNAVPVQLATAVSKAVLYHISKYHPLGLGTDIYQMGSFPAISLFSGAGGMDIGVLLAEYNHTIFDIKTCVEIDQDCCETLRKNFSNTICILNRDVTSIQAQSLLDKFSLDHDVIPMIFGGPPCQSFSQAGKQKGAHDPRGQLIFEFLRIIRELKPI